MTVGEVLHKVDTLKPNRFDRPTKMEWLGQIEGQIFEEIVLTHEHPHCMKRNIINKDTDPDTVLIAPFPYDEVYTLWLQCQIDLGNMEITKYNNDRTLFNNALMTLRDYWNRKYMPLERAHSLSFTGHDMHMHHRHKGPFGGE